ncbi:3791_t:CDS:2 [Funneliformis mosseae]|uniref:Multiple inositol polyphosphate phosphatase 1 n=1 Tax=Funneliformis mosseae TaxID=27381 RepID=A0A9N9GP34_FUNMO|nr:3791_t:CDS:2 [Funneliformis mosseae]
MQFSYQIVWTNFLALIFFTSPYYHDINIERHMISNTKYPIMTDKQPKLSSPNHCNLEKLFLVARHGTRYPEEPDIKKFEVLENIFQNVSSKHKVFIPNYVRTGMSGISYSIGLLDGKGILGKGDYQPVYISTIPVLQDYELAIHRSCPRWKETVQNNNEKLEKQIFHFTSNLTKISNRISKKYNIENPPLEPIHVNYIYLACAYDIIFFEKNRHWCEILQQEEILTLEYFNDMRYYYEFSYGSDLNKQLACKLVGEIVKGVDDYLNGDSTVKADLKFTHSETMMFLYTFLGLYEDSNPLTGNATFDEISNRKFKTSEICPFAANVYFEIYTCASDKYTFFYKKKHEESTVVQVVVNEKPVVVPGCGSKFCEWNKFKELFSDNLDCDFEKICNFDKN